MATRANVVYVCRFLRTKTMFIPDERENRVLVEPSDTAMYWCNKTGNGMGPDADFVGPRDCKYGRDCFVSAPLLLKPRKEL
ncbi:MAG: hypothetical protein O3A46_01695 [Candidatus Poribacteria bacterium]|nr:hypothetical protein [Candidatus Poribacteria bacterium]